LTEFDHILIDTDQTFSGVSEDSMMDSNLYEEKVSFRMDKEREPPAEWINQYDFEGMPDYSGIML
jgi:hypothetical protein